MSPNAQQTVRFGLFEVHLGERVLAKDGRKIRLQEQPFRILEMLLEEPGATVTRDRLKTVLWATDTFVDFDHSLNASVAKLRQALDDSADNPRFIATQARRGYRFIAPVEKPAQPQLVPEPPLAASPETPAHPIVLPRSRSWVRFAFFAVFVGLAVAGGFVWVSRSSERGERQIIQVTFNAGLTTDPAISADGKLLAYASDRGGNSNLNIWLQQLNPGGSIVQLTHEDGDTRQPAFSPDGSRIVFRCASRGGICVIPTIGGNIVQLAAEGLAPRFSPDGNWLAYQSGINVETAASGRTEGLSFIMPSAGGQAKQVASDLYSACEPIWSPDSRFLLVRGTHSQGGSEDRFLVPIGGGASRPTGIHAALLRQGFPPPTFWSSFAAISQWSNGYLVFSAAFGDVSNLWRMPVSGEGCPTGKAQRISSGTGTESSPVVSPDGTLFFGSSASAFSIWSLPLDAEKAQVRGALRRITPGPSDLVPSITRDGRLMAYSNFDGRRKTRQNAQVHVRDLVSGKEYYATAPGAASESGPHISSDGSHLALLTRNRQMAEVLTLRDPSSRRTLGPFYAWDWSRDNKRILLIADTHERVISINAASGHKMFELSDPGHLFFQARFAPDDRFVAALITDKESVDGRLFVAPLRENSRVLPSEWIWIDHKARDWEDRPHWSPDGKLLYFISNRDGHLCLWAQRLATETMQPEGKPFAVWHFHNAAVSLQNVGVGIMGLDIAANQVVFGLGESTGNIWSVSGKPVF